MLRPARVSAAGDVERAHDCGGQDETLTIEEEQEATQATDDAKAADAKPEAADETGAADADHRGRAQRAQQDPNEKKEELATEDSKANEVRGRTLARRDARAPAQWGAVEPTAPIHACAG